LWVRVRFRYTGTPQPYPNPQPQLLKSSILFDSRACYQVCACVAKLHPNPQFQNLKQFLGRVCNCVCVYLNIILILKPVTWCVFVYLNCTLIPNLTSETTSRAPFQVCICLPKPVLCCVWQCVQCVAVCCSAVSGSFPSVCLFT